MFTGLIKDIGIIKSVTRKPNGLDLSIESLKLASISDVDDSVSVNGCCQTIVSLEGNIFHVNVVESTMRKSNLGSLKINDRVNLELAMRYSDRIGGHIVQGHVNAVARILSILKIDNFYKLTIKYSDHSDSLKMIDEGSISINGISLTINSVDDDNITFDIFVIPHTWENTTLKYSNIGDYVNVEFDVIAQYINRILSKGSKIVKNEEKIKNFLKGSI